MIDSDLVIEDSEIRDNVAVIAGAFRMEDNNNLTLVRVTIDKSKAEIYGGVLCS